MQIGKYESKECYLMGASRTERLARIIWVNLEAGSVYLAEETSNTKAWRRDWVCCLREGEKLNVARG